MPDKKTKADELAQKAGEKAQEAAGSALERLRAWAEAKGGLWAKVAGWLA